MTTASATWPNLIEGDYGVGVVRLATLSKSRVNHLLFASVELLPTEMSSPCDDFQRQNFSDYRLCVSRTVLPLDEALEWYQSLLANTANLPGQATPLTAVAFSAEPPHNGFVLVEPPPFSPAWHNRPRLHRLVPMTALDPVVVSLRDGETNAPAQVRARAWLREQMHFDLLAYDDWLGGAALVAPNPVLRRCRARIAERTSQGETIEVGGKPRIGADISTLQITIEERRAGAAGWRAYGAPDVFGRFRGVAPAEVDTVRHDLVCARRGTLDEESAYPFFRSFWVGVATEGKGRLAAPPKRSPSSDPLKVQITPKTDAPPKAPVTALRQLELLQQARAERTGDRQPQDAPRGPSEHHLFETDRDVAVAAVRRLIAQARETVMFVDPYLDADDLQEFAMAASHEGVVVRGLINPRPGVAKRTDPTGAQAGEAMLAQIEAMRAADQGFGAIDVRVSTSRRLHDRFLVVDRAVWHCGHSFNNIGNGEISMMSRAADPSDIRAALQQAFDGAIPFDTWWRDRTAPQWTWRHKIARRIRDLAARLERGPKSKRGSRA